MDKKLELLDQWKNDRTKLLFSAAELMARCVEWPGKQDEDFNSVLFDMEAWLCAFDKHDSKLASDLE